MSDEERAKALVLANASDKPRLELAIYRALAAIRAEEREACAKMVEESSGCVINLPWDKAHEVAAAIRARSKG
jgi:hypothetical protein